MPTLTRKEVEDIALLARLHLDDRRARAHAERARRDPRALRRARRGRDRRRRADDARGADGPAAARRRASSRRCRSADALRGAPAHDGDLFVVPAIIPAGTANEAAVTAPTEWLSVAETGAAGRGRRAHGARARRPPPGADRERRWRARRVPRVDGARRARRAPPRSTASAPRTSRSDRSPACRSRSRTCSSPRASPPPRARRSSTAGCRPTTRTVVERLRAAGAVVLGKLNCDEFAMGSSTERSAYQQTQQPVGHLARARRQLGRQRRRRSRRGLCAASLGTDTGGSIRQPAAFCGVVGLKPTYGRVSRWGVVAFASSLDQVGPLTRTRRRRGARARGDRRARPARLDLARRAGPDVHATRSTGDVAGPARRPARTSTSRARSTPRSAPRSTSAIAALVERGAELVDISLPHTTLALPAYYIVAPAEASSNLARYDGVRYGMAAPRRDDLLDLYMRSRAARASAPRSSAGSCSAPTRCARGYYDAYYKKAQQIRTLIKRDFDEAFAARRRDPDADHADRRVPVRREGDAARHVPADVFTLSCNLAGLPGHQRAVRAHRRRPADRRAAARQAARRGDAAPRRRR